MDVDYCFFEGRARCDVGDCQGRGAVQGSGAGERGGVGELEVDFQGAAQDIRAKVPLQSKNFPMMFLEDIFDEEKEGQKRSLQDVAWLPRLAAE